MALSVGTDTYGTVDEADVYFARRPHGEAWVDDLELTQKENALWMARYHLDDAYDLTGVLAEDDQLMLWPRGSMYDSSGRVFDATIIPEEVKYAQFELALQWAITDQLQPTATSLTAAESNGGQQVKRRELGPLKLEFFENQSFLFDLSAGRLRTKVYPLVDLYMRRFGATRRSGAYARLVV